MNHLVPALALCTLATFSSLGAMAQDQVVATQPTDVEEVRLSVGREDEYDALIADLGLSGQQLATFEATNRDRLAKLRAFVEGEEGKRLIELREQLAAARREKRPPADIASLREQIQPLSDQYWSIRNGGRIALLQTLDESQLKRSAGFSLTSRVLRGLERARLTDEQRRRVREIADEAAAAWYRPERVKEDPYFRGLASVEHEIRERVFTEVLTPEQRDILRARRPATRPER